MFLQRLLLLTLTLSLGHLSIAQVEVPIDNHSVNVFGQVQLSIQGDASKYYVLEAQHSPSFQWPTSIAMGVNGTMVISEPGAAYPVENYTVWEHDISSPGDTDGDGVDDITEYQNMPTDAPLNYAAPVDFEDGSTSIPDAETFMSLATVNNVGWAPFLDDQLYVKFGILDRDTPEPKVYFINSNTHTVHFGFWGAIDANVIGDDSSGEIVFYPTQINPNGTVGGYSFNFSFGNAYDFEDTQRTYQLLLASMPFLQNNMTHFIGEGDEDDYFNNYAGDYEDSGIEVVLESEVFGDVDYIPLHQAEGYGFFRHMEVDETPGSRDIVLYDALPNSLPRVGGIMTSVIQTPLSHVNLRAIQDNVPNAYIADPLSIDSISSLLGNYIYFKVEQETFQIREATLEEVNAWYEDLRPTEAQVPERDLSITAITPLDDIAFDMSTAFGAKCSNLATMRTFGFPEGTIPDGFGIPFYFYDEFMQFNNFYEEAEVMIDNESFVNDIAFREDRLRDFRDDIKDAPMPAWMLQALQDMHDDFPPGTAVRCRSSTNNEDLPGFSGAGLYTSKTQHLDEGHISKSIKQVYASMWNFRAYEERDFYRVDHFMAAMGVLCHPNFQEEKSNGVGISLDPIYDTQGTFYLNTQVGESLITNPEPNAVPEEILLYEDATQGAGYVVLRLSNLVDPGELVMEAEYLDLMREYLGVIHDEFAVLYGVEDIEGFGMDIEYKVTAQDQLAIKQARPWVSFWAGIKADNDLAVEELIDPQSSSSLGNSELITLKVANTGLNDMSNFDLSLLVNGEPVETLTITETIAPFGDAEFQFATPQDFSSTGEYLITGIVSDPEDGYANNDTLDFVLTNLHVVNAGISFGQVNPTCNEQMGVNAIVTNGGEQTIESVEIEVTVNGSVVDVVEESVDIESGEQGLVTFTIEDNLLPTDNNIQMLLIGVNGDSDEDLSDNAVFTLADLDVDFETVTLQILADDYPSETSWEVVDLGSGQVVSGGDFPGGMDLYSEDICVAANACLTLTVYDSFGDGMCCAYGEGNFQVLNANGEVMVFNDGDFSYEAVEFFCAGDGGCQLAAEIEVEHATSEVNNDGTVVINLLSDGASFTYSINGGQSFGSDNTFDNLEPGLYEVVVQNESGQCTYEETVSIDVCDFTNIGIAVNHPASVVTTDGAIVITVNSGENTAQYSIDGGQTFYETGEFTGLPVGDYNVVVLDNAGICEFEYHIPLLALGIVGVEDQQVIENDIRLYPNPTSHELTVELVSFESLDEAIQVVVHDHLGRSVQSATIGRGTMQTVMPLQGLARGTYIVRCFNSTFARNFKIIKL
ncbi:T9SS type A sorting domain-containing protein [Flavobacteriales bacterium]|nr:T9SS type A sorting domain-containing protein [Flavobacteriales bacterium]